MPHGVFKPKEKAAVKDDRPKNRAPKINLVRQQEQQQQVRMILQQRNSY